MEKIYDVIIIGAGPAGLTAAIYTSRTNLSTLVIEKEKIGSMLLAHKVQNYPGVSTSISGTELYNYMRNQSLEFGTEIVDATLLGFDPYEDIKIVKTDKENYKCKNIVIATGMGTFWTKKIKGEEKFLGEGVSYCATCDGFFTKEKTVSLVGKGEEVAAEALFLTRFSKEVKVFVTEDQLICEQDTLDALHRSDKVKIITNSKLKEILGDEDGVNKLILEISGETVEEDTNFVFLYLGTKDNAQLYGEFANISKEGFVITDEKMKIKLPGMYAIGDIRDKEVRQITTATADGTIAASDIIKSNLKKIKN